MQAIMSKLVERENANVINETTGCKRIWKRIFQIWKRENTKESRISLNKSVITINVNGLNTPIKQVI